MRGWEVELKDGSIMSEQKHTWGQVPKKDIVRLTLHYDGRRWDLNNKEAYFVRNRASMVPGQPESFRIEERVVGYYEGSNKVVYKINEFTGELTLTVE